MDIKSNDIAVGYLQQGLCATTAPLGLWFHAGLRCGHKHHSCVGVLVAFLLWKLVWHFLVLLKLVLKEAMFWSVPAQGPLGQFQLLRISITRIFELYMAHTVLSNTVIQKTDL